MRRIARNLDDSLIARIAEPESLFRAWKKVRANRGCAGADAVSLVEFERNLKENLRELGRNLRTGSYEPVPLRSVTIVKKNGMPRELAIPAVRDRVAQRATLDVLEPVFEPIFTESSYAFRPGRSIDTAIQHLAVARMQGNVWTLDADVRDFFPSIDHELMVSDFARVLPDTGLIELIGKWIRAGIFETVEPPRAGWAETLRDTAASVQLSIREHIEGIVDRYAEERLGVPSHPSVIDVDTGDDLAIPDDIGRAQRKALLGRLVESGILFAITQRALIARIASPQLLGLGGAALVAAYLMPRIIRQVGASLDRPVGVPQGAPISPMLANLYLHAFDVKVTAKGYRLFRYCDDFVVPCRTEAEAKSAMKLARSVLRERKMDLSEEKTRIVSPNETLEYLGYRLTPEGLITPPEGLPGGVVRRVRMGGQVALSAVSRASGTGAEAARRKLVAWLRVLADRLSD